MKNASPSRLRPVVALHFVSNGSNSLKFRIRHKFRFERFKTSSRDPLIKLCENVFLPSKPIPIA